MSDAFDLTRKNIIIAYFFDYVSVKIKNCFFIYLKSIIIYLSNYCIGANNRNITHNVFIINL